MRLRVLGAAGCAERTHFPSRSACAMASAAASISDSPWKRSRARSRYTLIPLAGYLRVVAIPV